MLTNKIALITGAASGTGRAIATLFARNGAKVVAVDYHPVELAAAADDIKKAGGTITTVAADVSDLAQCEAMIDAAISAYGRLDILVNNAGVMDLMQAIGDLDLDIWKRVMSINVDGPVFAMRKAVPLMLAQGNGVILNVDSVAGLGGAAAGVAYVASKHALSGLTLNTAWLYAKRGIRCNAMALGGIETNIMQSIDATKIDPAGAARCGQYHALMPEIIKPEAVAELALFLVSDQSRHINGAIIPIDAGWRAA